LAPIRWANKIIALVPRGFNVFEPFGRFRVYYHVIAEEIHVERLLEVHRLAASDDR